MTFSGGTKEVINKLADHALSTGLFGTVRGSEPKAGPKDSSLVCAFWLQSLTPAPGMSGLNGTAWRMGVIGRIYDSSAFSPESPYAVGDATISDAAVDLMEAYTGDFSLGDSVRLIDLMGAHGDPLRGTFGYINQDNTIYRNFDITIPLIMNQEWSQTR